MKLFFRYCCSACALVAARGESRLARTYGLQPSGWRYSELKQIDTGNIARLAPKWIFQSGLPGVHGDHASGGRQAHVYHRVRQTTPTHWTSEPEKPMWHYSKTPPKGLGLCCGEVNRGFAMIGNRIFKVNIEDHLVALDKITGELLWETEIADHKKGYIGNRGAHRGEESRCRGHGRRRVRHSRFHRRLRCRERQARLAILHRGRSRTNPAATPGVTGARRKRPGSVAEVPPGLPAPTIPSSISFTGAPAIPGPDMNGDVRPGDNLYTCSVVALDADTGKLKWHFQFTPHDTHDWDAISDPVLVDLHRARPQGQSADPGQSQWLLLRPGPYQRQDARGQAVYEGHLGLRRSERMGGPS